MASHVAARRQREILLERRYGLGILLLFEITGPGKELRVGQHLSDRRVIRLLRLQRCECSQGLVDFSGRVQRHRISQFGRAGAKALGRLARNLAHAHAQVNRVAGEWPDLAAEAQVQLDPFANFERNRDYDRVPDAAKRGIFYVALDQASQNEGRIIRSATAGVVCHVGKHDRPRLLRIEEGHHVNRVRVWGKRLVLPGRQARPIDDLVDIALRIAERFLQH